MTSLSCGPANSSTSSFTYSTICISCGSLAVEPYGCTFWYRLNGAAAVQLPASAPLSINGSVLLGPFSDSATPIVVFGSTDAAGNVGSQVILTFSVDLQAPTTWWPPRVRPSPLMNSSSATFAFDCNDLACRFDYQLDGGSRLRLGGNNSLSYGDDSSSMSMADTSVIAYVRPLGRTINGATTVFRPHMLLSSGSIRLTPSASTGNATVQVRVDRAVVWTDVRSLSSVATSESTATVCYIDGNVTLTGLSDGLHVFEARTVNTSTSGGAVDSTPSAYVWRVDNVPPVIRFVVAPPAIAAQPKTTAWFVFASSEALTLYSYRLRMGSTLIR